MRRRGKGGGEDRVAGSLLEIELGKQGGGGAERGLDIGGGKN